MMKVLTKTLPLLLMVVLCLAMLPRIAAAEAEARPWDSLLDITYKFSWYPQADLEKLLEMKTTEFGQSLEEYRAELAAELTGKPAEPELRTKDFVAGAPWRDYYRLSMAEFCLFLATGQEAHLQNAQATLDVLVGKTEQPEIAFWYYLYGAHAASLAKDRDAFITQMYRLWQNVVIPLEVESANFPDPAAEVGFGKDLPFLYENLMHLLLRKAILEQEIPDLYALNVLLFDIQPKLSVENGYRVMAEQVVARMEGPGSDNQNINFAVALLEATAKRYAFEDEKDPTQLTMRLNQARKYYHLAIGWADTDKGKAAILTEYVGFMNYVVRRLSDPADPLAADSGFANLPAMAGDQMEAAFAVYDRLAKPDRKDEAALPKGFIDRREYLVALHRLLDSGAKLAIVLADYHQGSLAPDRADDAFAAAHPLERYLATFEREARLNADVLPDNAYFLAAYAARDLGAFYREQARFSTGNQASALAFAYQMQAIELFPLDLPTVLQMAFQSSQAGQVQAYFRYTRPLSTRLQTSATASGGATGGPAEFASLLALMPLEVPTVINNAYVLLAHFPDQQTSEDALFARAVAMARALRAPGVSAADQAQRLEQIGARPAVEAYPFFDLKSQLFASTDSPLHSTLRALFNEVPYIHHQYVALRSDLF